MTIENILQMHRGMSSMVSEAVKKRNVPLIAIYLKNTRKYNICYPFTETTVRNDPVGWKVCAGTRK